MNSLSQIKTFLRLWAILLLLLFSQAATARVSIYANKEPLSPAHFSMKFFEDSSSQYDLQRFLAIQPFLKNIPPENLRMSYRNEMFWLQLDLSSLPLKDSIIYLEIHNPHINFLGAWLMLGDSAVQAFQLTGDHLPFDTRSVQHPQFIFKLKHDPTKQLKLVLLVDKRNEQLHVPINFFSENEFLHFTRTNNMLAGLLGGISFFILLFTIFLYFNIRDRVYVYYGIYVTMVAGYIISDFGLSFMFFYPNTPHLADFARPFTISLAPVFYILFSDCLLNTRKNFPVIHRVTNGYVYFYLFSFVMGILIAPNTGDIRVFWLIFMQVLLGVSIIPVFIIAIMGLRKKVPYSGYVLLACAVFTFFIQVYMQYITGNLGDNPITRNAMCIGFGIEISLLTLALSLRFKNYKLHAEELLRERNSQQENIFKTVSEYQENEMNRLSGMLHDSIGAGLSSIKFNLEAVDGVQGNSAQLLRTTIEDVTNLTDEVRNISHSMSPVLLQKKGLLAALNDLISSYNRTGKIQIVLESIGSCASASFQNELLVYRIIQELLQNTVKHAHATEVIIQVMLEPELISIFVEDNGRGFDESHVKDGLGFSQIRGLVKFVNGHFELNSQVNKGCRVSIEFPVIPYEPTDQSIVSRRSPYVS